MSWLLASMTVLAFVLASGFIWYERSHPSARVLALIAALAALAALGRIAFAPVPQIKPTTDIVLLAGYVLGGAPGFAVGAVGALASNLFFGQGPWTPWQMGAWGAIGVAGALLARATRQHAELGRIPLAAACAAAGLVYGGIMNFSLWATFSGDHTLDQLVFFATTSFPFDVAHAVGNALFCLAFGPALVRALRRYRARFEVTWRPAPASVVAASALLALLLAAATLQPAGAGAAVPKRTLDYLAASQNADGGFPGTPGQASTQLHTGWAGLGLAAGGRNPLDVRSGGKDVLDFVAANGSQLDDLGAVARTILLYEASGRPARIGSRDLVAELVRKRRANGSFAGRANTTAFAVMALRASGRGSGDRVVRRAGRWLAGQANRDGGYNFGGRGGPSGVDDTGAVIQGLVTAGRGRTRTVTRAASFIVRRQNADGGFPLQPGAASNAQSTAWAVQGLVAAGREPARVRRKGSRDPIAYLESLIGSNGAVRYSRTSNQTPVWVTAQAITALARQPFPFDAAARRARPSRRSTPAAPSRAATPRATPASRARAPKRAGTTPAPRSAEAGQKLTPGAAALLARNAGVAVSIAANAAW